MEHPVRAIAAPSMPPNRVLATGPPTPTVRNPVSRSKGDDELTCKIQMGFILAFSMRAIEGTHMVAQGQVANHPVRKFRLPSTDDTRRDHQPSDWVYKPADDVH